MTLIVREGVTSVGMHVVGISGVFVARGWIKSLEMLAGPKEFSLYFNNTNVATTSTGVITIANFTAAAREEMARHTSPNDVLRSLLDDGYFNMTYQQRVHIFFSEPPPRQTYYIAQTWAQAFKKKQQKNDADGDKAGSSSDMDIVEVPCIRAFNLRSDDATAKITRTYVLETN